MSANLIKASVELNDESLLNQVAGVYSQLRVLAPGAELVLHLSDTEVIINADGQRVYEATHRSGYGLDKSWSVEVSPILLGDKEAPVSWKCSIDLNASNFGTRLSTACNIA